MTSLVLAWVANGRSEATGQSALVCVGGRFPTAACASTAHCLLQPFTMLAEMNLLDSSGLELRIFDRSAELGVVPYEDTLRKRLGPNSMMVKFWASSECVSCGARPQETNSYFCFLQNVPLASCVVC
uniref:Uncharacterized protein n=1 Tax=Ixodes ricinus TaxID=34613 RepID=A0A6B0UQ62_IXORI